MPVNIAGALTALSLVQAPTTGGDAFLQAQRAPPFEGFPPALVVSAFEELAREWTVVSVYTQVDRSQLLPNGRPSPFWIARLETSPRSGGGGVRWADSRRCPKLVGALYELDQLPLDLRVEGLSIYVPVPEFPARLYPDRPLGGTAGLTMDGVTFTVQSRNSTQADGSSASITISSNEGPVARWGNAMTKALEPCWRAEAPSVR